MSQFSFLASDFPDLLMHTHKVETSALSDHRRACLYASLTLEVALKWLYQLDLALRHLCDSTLAALVADHAASRHR